MYCVNRTDLYPRENLLPPAYESLQLRGKNLYSRCAAAGVWHGI